MATVHLEHRLQALIQKKKKKKKKKTFVHQQLAYSLACENSGGGIILRAGG